MLRNFAMDFYRTLIQETGTSFIFGATAVAVKTLWSGNNNGLTKCAKAVRSGAEHAKFSLLYNTAHFIFRQLHIKHTHANALSFFVSSYIIGRRNGVLFAIKNSVFGLILALLGQVYK